VELNVLVLFLRLEHVEAQLSTHKWELMEHGAHAQHPVAQELNPEAAHVLLEMLVERNVLVLFPRLEHVEAQSSTHDWELSEHGAHALPRVDLELKLEAVCVLPVTHVVHHVTEL